MSSNMDENKRMDSRMARSCRAVSSDKRDASHLAHSSEVCRLRGGTTDTKVREVNTRGQRSSGQHQNPAERHLDYGSQQGT